jgi:hypothetical protein
MTTWAEAVAAKRERLLRESRFYTPDLLSKRKCRFCGTAMPVALILAGENDHATCGPNGDGVRL